MLNTSAIDVEFMVLNPDLHENGWTPVRSTKGAAGYDIRSCERESVVVSPQQTHTFKLGFAMHIANRSVGALIMPRSGLGSRGLILANSIGLIDSDYMGEVKAVVRNANPLGSEDIEIRPGDRFLQMIFVPVIEANFVPVSAFSKATERGDRGFGSTGA